MKAIINFFVTMFCDANGDTSSKRVSAVALIISGIVYAFIKSDFQMCSVLIGAGVTLLTAAAITKT